MTNIIDATLMINCFNDKTKDCETITATGFTITIEQLLWMYLLVAIAPILSTSEVPIRALSNGLFPYSVSTTCSS